MNFTKTVRGSIAAAILISGSVAGCADRRNQAAMDCAADLAESRRNYEDTRADLDAARDQIRFWQDYYRKYREMVEDAENRAIYGIGK